MHIFPIKLKVRRVKVKRDMDIKKAGKISISLKERVLEFFNFENVQMTLGLLNEAIINQHIFDIYDLGPEDRKQVESKVGKSVGELPVLPKAKAAYLSTITLENETVKKFVQNLTTTAFDEQKIQTIKAEFANLYQSNNDLEEFCIRHQLNPINVWYWFRESKVLPQARTVEIALEFLADACRTILMQDEDDIIPLVGLPGEPRLLDELEAISKP